MTAPTTTPTDLTDLDYDPPCDQDTTPAVWAATTPCCGRVFFYCDPCKVRTVARITAQLTSRRRLICRLCGRYVYRLPAIRPIRGA